MSDQDGTPAEGGWHPMLTYALVGAVVAGGVAQSGILVTATFWGTVGAAILGAALGRAVYRVIHG